MSEILLKVTLKNNNDLHNSVLRLGISLTSHYNACTTCSRNITNLLYWTKQYNNPVTPTVHTTDQLN